MKPMLSGKASDLSALAYPIYASPKLDGIRALWVNGQLLTRNLKPVRNKAVQQKFAPLGEGVLHGLDGELVWGDPASPSCFRDTTSAVMSEGGDAEGVRFFVFDSFRHPQRSWEDRWPGAEISEYNRRKLERHGIVVVEHELCYTAELVQHCEEHYLEQGYEGAMLRAPGGPYKYGRSTEKEGWLLKLKRFEDAEARVVRVIEQQRNANPATKDALGRTKRTTHKAGKVGKSTAGALAVVGINGQYKGVEFDVGSGMDDALRQAIWSEREQAVGRIVKYKYFPGGSKSAPRFPVFLGFRDDADDQLS